MMTHRLWTTALGAVVGAALACGESDGGGPPDLAPGFDRSTLLASVADRVIVPTYTEFVDRADDLRAATAAWAEAPDDAARRAAAQRAWEDAADVWQRAELMQVGPAGAAGVTGRTGGLGLRQEIYSWPLDSACRVDQALIENRFDESGYFEEQVDSVFGLDALEYVLFVPSDDNACDDEDALPIDAQGLWDDFVAADGEPIARRAAYAGAVAEKLKADADRLAAEWTAGFRDRFVDAGQAGSPFGTAQQALDELFAAMFYLELETVDEKLGAPAGLTGDCMTTCPEAAESPWADRGRVFIRENVEGFGRVFHGGAEDDPAVVGFDDYLSAAGANALARDLDQRLEEAHNAVEDVEPALREALASAETEIEPAFEAVSRLMVLVETEFVSVLALEIPREGAGDND